MPGFSYTFVEQVGFIEKQNQRGVVGDGDGEGGREGLGCIEYKNRYGSVVECPTAAVNTDSFDGVGGVAQSGSIDDAELIVANVE